MMYAFETGEAHLELPHADKGGPNVADDFEAHLLAGVGYLRIMEDIERFRG